MKMGHCTGHKRARKPRAATIARDQQRAAELERRIAERARQLLVQWDAQAKESQHRRAGR
jgi:hypothetical protein